MYATNGSMQKYKARLVEKGFAQHIGIEYNETYVDFARKSCLVMKSRISLCRKYKIVDRGQSQNYF
jgi:hypothetical protein